MSLRNLHPQLSIWTLELLNDYSNTLILVREYDEDSGQFYVLLNSKATEVVEINGKNECLSDHVSEAWRFDTKEDVDELIALLRQVRDGLLTRKDQDAQIRALSKPPKLT